MAGAAAPLALVAGGAFAVCGWWAYQMLAATPAGQESGSPGGRFAAGARLCGLLGGYLGVVQVLMAARVPWIESTVPLDRLRAVHAVNGLVFLVLAVAHAVLAVAAEAADSGAHFVGATIGLTLHGPYVWLAVLGLGMLVAVGAASARRARRLVRYGWWHLAHLAVYPALTISFAHQLYGDDLVATPARVLWTGLHVAALLAVGWYRVLLPVRLGVRHQLRVTEVVVEGPGVVSVWVSGRRLDRLGTLPGQYFRWRVLTRPLWPRSHPFSVSAVPTARRMRFTARAVGDYTDALLSLRPGARVLVSGPYGAFTERVRRGRRVLLVAGGAGITPLRALLEGIAAEPGEITLVYRTDRPDHLIFTAELAELVRSRGAALHLVHGRATSDPATDPLGPGRLTALVPGLVEHDVYVCGPAAMVRFTRESLYAAGVDHGRIHTESFTF